jgi:WXXGXW repeat (2 copies)
MKLTQVSLFALACGAAPLAAYAGVEVGINIGVPEVVVGSQPPPLRVEAVPISPGPGYIWIRGHWRWHRGEWDWASGRWEFVTQPSSTWIPGQWVARGNGWVWIEGHYAVVAAPQPPPPGRQYEVFASEEPPAPIVEVVPVAPGPEFFWIGGHWSWNRGWVWTRGHYDRHPHFHAGAGWEPGRWDRRGNGWAWHEGHWR